jgi:hypothetical protein
LIADTDVADELVLPETDGTDHDDPLPEDVVMGWPSSMCQTVSCREWAAATKTASPLGLFTLLDKRDALGDNINVLRVLSLGCQLRWGSVVSQDTINVAG